MAPVPAIGQIEHTAQRRLITTAGELCGEAAAALRSRQIPVDAAQTSATHKLGAVDSLIRTAAHGPEFGDVNLGQDAIRNLDVSLRVLGSEIDNPRRSLTDLVIRTSPRSDAKRIADDFDELGTLLASRVVETTSAPQSAEAELLAHGIDPTTLA